MKFLTTLFLVLVLTFQACQQKQEPQKIETNNSVSIIEGFCYLKDIRNDGTKNYADIDFIEYLKSFDVDTSISNNQRIELPNGYSYVNRESKIETFEITDSVKIVLQTFSFDNEGNFNFNQPVQLKTLETELQKSGDKIFLHSPFKIKLQDNTIITLTEIYIP